MIRSYVFIYNDALGNRDEIKTFLNSCSLIKTWRFELPQSFFIVSENDAFDICASIRNYFGETKGTYLVVEYTNNADGLLLERSWDILIEKKLPPKKKNG